MQVSYCYFKWLSFRWIEFPRCKKVFSVLFVLRIQIVSTMLVNWLMQRSKIDTLSLSNRFDLNLLRQRLIEVHDEYEEREQRWNRISTLLNRDDISSLTTSVAPTPILYRGKESPHPRNYWFVFFEERLLLYLVFSPINVYFLFFSFKWLNLR